VRLQRDEARFKVLRFGPLSLAVIDLWYNAGQALFTLIEVESNPNLNMVMALSLERAYLRSRGRTIRALASLTKALSLGAAIGLDELGDENAKSGSWHADSKATITTTPLADGLFFYPLFGSTPADQSTSTDVFWYPNHSPLVLHAGRRMICHFATQTILEEASSLKIGHTPRYRLGREPSDLSGKITDDKEDKDVVFDVGVTEALSNVADAVETARSERENTDPIELEDDSQEEETLLEAFDNISLPPMSSTQISDTGSQACPSQRKMIELHIEYQKMVFYRRDGAANEASLDAARDLVSHRVWLQSHSQSSFAVSKVFTIQQYTLEAALVLVFNLVLGEEKSEKDGIAGILESILPLLILGAGREQTRAKNLVGFLHTSASQGESMSAGHASTLLSQYTGLRKDHIIVSTFAKLLEESPSPHLGSGDPKLWKAIHRYSPALLLPLPAA
jgi:hypothetical protein